MNPDAFFVLRDTALPESRQRTAFFLEADRSTLATKRLRQKFLDFSALPTGQLHQRPPFSIPSFTVLTVCKSHERAAGLLKIARGGGLLTSRLAPQHVSLHQRRDLRVVPAELPRRRVALRGRPWARTLPHPITTAVHLATWVTALPILRHSEVRR